MKKNNSNSPAKKFLRGDVPLATSFWGVYVGGGLAVGWGVGFLGLPIILFILIFFFLLYIFIYRNMEINR